MTKLYEAFLGKRRTVIKYKLKSNSTYVFEIDCTMSENHTLTNSITSHEVEEGASVNDNILNTPAKVSLSGIISDFPLHPFEITGFTITTEEDKPSMKALEVFREIMTKKIICTLETTLGEYEDMALIDISFPRDKDTINTLVFTANFQQIKYVYSEVTEVEKSKVKEDVKKKAPKKKNKGDKKPTKPTVKEEENSSLFYDGLAVKQ